MATIRPSLTLDQAILLKHVLHEVNRIDNPLGLVLDERNFASNFEVKIIQLIEYYNARETIRFLTE